MSEPLTQAERAELVAEVTRQHERSAFARKHMDLTDNSLLRYEATVAALTAENAQLRETLTLGLGEQESVIAGLRAVNERLRSALATLLAVAPPPIAGRNDYAAARDAARAADDSPSREDAHAALTALCAGAYGPKGGRKDYLFHLSSYHARVLMQLFDNLEAKCRQNRLAADPTPAAPDQAEGPRESRGDDVPSVTSRAEESVMDKGVFRYDTDKTRLGAPPGSWDPSHREIL